MLAPTPDLKEGAREVIQLLEEMQERAALGDLTHLCTIATTANGMVQARMAGPNTYYMQAFFGLSIMQDEIKQFLVMRRPANRDLSLTADYVCYNVAQYPCSYDFISWLVEHEMIRVAKGAPFPLKVCFYFGPENDPAFALQYARRQQMFENVMRPALHFIGAVEDRKAIGGVTQNTTFSLAPIVERVRNGEAVPQFKSVCEVNNNGPKPVVITLRETDKMTGRNSRIEDWIKFGRWLQQRGERVLFIRDTDKADEPLEDFETCPIASTNIDARMALYLGAKCNLFVSNGPMGLAYFTQVPWMAFQFPDPDDESYMNTPNCIKQFLGINPGEQLPWCSEQQRIVWEEPVFENMMTAWERMWDAQV